MRDSTHWTIGGATLVVTDTITTKLALDTGSASEMNVVMDYIIQNHGYLELAAVKLVILTTVYLIWKYAPSRDKKIHSITNWVIPRFTSTVGIFVTVMNSVQIAVIYTL